MRLSGALSPRQGSDDEADEARREHGGANDLRAVAAATRELVGSTLRPVGIHQDCRARYRADRPNDYFGLCGPIPVSPSTSVPIPLCEGAGLNRCEFEWAAPDLPTGWSGRRVLGEYLVVQRETQTFRQGV